MSYNPEKDHFPEIFIGGVVLLVLVIMILCVFSYNTEIKDRGNVVLPNGVSVSHYSFNKDGSHHDIFIHEGKKTMTDNYQVGKSRKSEVTIKE